MNVKNIKEYKSVNTDDLVKTYKYDYIMKFVDVFMVNNTSPNKKNKAQLCKDNNICNSTLKRYMKDLNMSSLYRSQNINTKKKIKQKSIKAENKKNLKSMHKAGSTVNISQTLTTKEEIDELNRNLQI